MSQEGASARATLMDVARRAEVSLKTASRALNGEPYVTEATRSRVIEAASALGYERNAAATLLASGHRSDTVGLITGDLSNPFYSMLAGGMESVLRERGMHLSVASSAESPEHEWSLATGLADAQARAIVVASSMRDHAPYAALHARGIPLVFVDRPPVGIDADAVVFDDVEGGRLAGVHLLQGGHRRIAFLGDFDWLSTSRGRLTGIGDVLRAAVAEVGGAESQFSVRMGVHDAAAATAVVAEMLALADPPTAIVAGNNRIMLGASAHLRHLPESERPALLGFDDFEWAEVIGATVVTGQTERMGEVAAQRALARMADRESASARTVLPMRLIARGSAERPPRG